MSSFSEPLRPYVLLAIYPHLNNQLLAVFRKYGIESRSASNYEIAIAMIQRTSPSVVVGYVSMGENTALSLLQTMYNQFHLNHIPVLAIVETSQVSKTAELEQAGVRACFVAPLDPLPFMEYVKNILESQ